LPRAELAELAEKPHADDIYNFVRLGLIGYDFFLLCYGFGLIFLAL